MSAPTEQTSLKADEGAATASASEAATVTPVVPAEPAAAATPAPAAAASTTTAPAAQSSVEITSEPKASKKKGLGCLPKPHLEPKYYSDVEYKNRDPSGLHPDIKVNFSDVIAEPEGAHSFATIWGTSYKTYQLSKFWCYRILTAVLAVPLSVFWGLYFALLAFCSIWCIAPCIKGFIIWTNFISKIWGLMVRTFLDPLFESIGLIFTKIQVTLRMKNEGEIKSA